MSGGRLNLSWPEAAVLIVVAAGATIANVLSGFDALPVYVGVLGWGGRAALG